MLDSTTKRNIDAARNVLVGKVPDPKAQVEQITTALIYKFMDDMDQESVELGGQATFFTGEYDKYSWSELMDTRLSGEGRLDLYTQAISRISRNPNLPQFFRDIFKDSFLPYRDPQTLSLFLKEINKFTYDHSEELGNAFEYLLSVLGSQGDAGQFRTPRHIIDFMVEVVDPQKTDTILDPACGTAGFLISAYKHIRKKNSSNYAPGKGEITEIGETAAELILTEKEIYKGDLLTPTERKKLSQNIQGYDISPDMVRLSLVNMYLHGFPNPKIYEYDTLTSEKRWDETFDVILANPPFMTPKGGIRPHKRFQVQANRSEVLFVDYILEHMNINGRAGIIVPEGIIFKGETAFKSLRRLIVDDGLYSVVSLPSGVFNPYSGVKTSILFFDTKVADKTDEILFIKVENDGYDLGAQRRKIKSNDLPTAISILSAWKNGEKSDSDLANWAKKEKISINGQYNLTGARYKEVKHQFSKKWPNVKLEDIISINFGTRITKRDNLGSKYPVYGGGGESFRTDSYNRKPNLVISRFGMSENCVRYVSEKFFLLDSGFTYEIKKGKRKEISKEYIDKVLLYRQEEIYNCGRGNAQKNININQFKDISIPLPPLGVQQEIVEQIEVKQAAIDGAKTVIKNLEEGRRFFGFDIDNLDKTEWVKLSEICEINSKSQYPKERFKDGKFTYIDISSVENGSGKISFDNLIDVNQAPSRAKRIVNNNDVIISTVRPNLRSFALLSDIPKRSIASTGFAVLTAKEGLLPGYLYEIIWSDLAVNQMVRRMGKGAYPSINQKDVKQIKIPLPPLEIQREFVEEMEERNQIIMLNQRLIEIMEKNIDDIINRL